jgi:hypothetical protein
MNRQRFFLSENGSSYHTVLNDFQLGYIHYVDTKYYTSSILISLLTYNLDFVLMPINYESAIHTHVITYSKYSKEILPAMLNTFHIGKKIPKFVCLT